MGVSLARIVQFIVKVFSIVLLVVAGVQCEAEADAHTLAQVAQGLTYGGIITGVDYGHGLVTGYGALGNINRGNYYYAGYGPGFHHYGKREAEPAPLHSLPDCCWTAYCGCQGHWTPSQCRLHRLHQL